MADGVHEIRTETWRSPISGLTYWVAKCTGCRYASTRYMSKGNAERAGSDHVKDKS